MATTSSARRARLDKAGPSARRGLDVRDEADEVRSELGRNNRLIGLFPCECGRADCVLTVPLTAAEYDATRPRPIEARAHRA